MQNKKGFTLIELLVVVLIIGILAAVALPQYQKAVEKSRFTQALTMLKSVETAVENYQLTNGEYPTSFEQLDITIPWTGNTAMSSLPHITDSRSNEDWSISLYSSSTGANSLYQGLIITRLTGPYVGGGFAIWAKHVEADVPPYTIVCSENGMGSYITAQAGLVCEKLLHSKQVLASGSGGRLYSFQE